MSAGRVPLPIWCCSSKGFSFSRKKPTSYIGTSVDVLVPTNTCNPLLSSGFESLQHPLTCTTSFSCKGDTWGLRLPQLLLTHACWCQMWWYRLSPVRTV